MATKTKSKKPKAAAPARPAAGRKAPAKARTANPATAKAVKTVAKKAPAKKAAAKKAPDKKREAKAAPARKAAESRPAAAKAPAKKPAAKSAPRKAPAKPAARKPAVKPTAKKAAAKKTVTKSAPKKAAPPKPASKKAPARKPAERPSAAKAAPAKNTPARSQKAAAAKTPAGSQKQAAAKTPAKPTANRAPAKPAAKPAAPKSPPPKKMGDFACGDYVVYPTHGVGRIEVIEDREIAGHNLRLFVIHFDKEKMTLRVPVDKAEESGLRKLSTRQQIDVALSTLRGRSRVSRAMWSRRAQEYEAKINSGDPVSIAEVVRDLHRNAGQPDQSYSERQIYEAALERLARELAAVEKIDPDSATVKLEQVLEKAA